MRRPTKHSKFFWISMGLFIFVYPMFISIYVFLPLLIGGFSYILIEGVKREKSYYIFIAMIYLLNLEVNLSLPLFLTVISASIFYVSVYPNLKYLRICPLCQHILSVFLLNIFYFSAIFFFDFIFQTQSIVLDKILLYSLIVDTLIVVIV